MNTTAVVTIVSNNYLHFARTLMQSVARQHPDVDRYCVVVDRDPGPAAALSAEFQSLSMDQLDLPDGDDFMFQYNILELNTAVKPWALAHLMRCGYQHVVYIDPDIALYKPLDDVFSLLENGADLVLTPHLLSPIDDALRPAELDIRRAGTYNLGFCALRSGGNMQALLTWWQAKLRRDCIIAQDRGIFVDQSWMDLVPGLFDNVAVLRHPGYNVAYWNIAQRPVVQEDSGHFLVAGQPLVFFHYSGLDPLNPHPVSKHQNRFTLDSVSPSLKELVNDYCRQIKANNIDHYRTLAYGFAHFDDGVPISDNDRSRFRTSDELRKITRGQPFACRQLLSPVQPVSTVVNLQADDALDHIYAHFLNREPDESARRSYQRRQKTPLRQLQTVYYVATSREAKSRPGWLARLLSWPLRHAQFSGQVLMAPAMPLAVSQTTARPSPYGGLHAAEPDSARQGLWVGPRLDLPVCALTAGKITITGVIDLKLLARGRPDHDFVLDLHGPLGLVQSTTLTESGPFSIDVTVAPHAFFVGSQWTLLASNHVVPKNIGLGEDTRELAWRVTRIQCDDMVLIDSARSPAVLAIETLMPAGGINLIGYLAAEVGLGEAARALACACVAADIPFSATDVGFQSQNLQRDTRLLAQAVPDSFPIDLMYVNADQTAATAHYLKAQNRQPARYKIGYWHWEQPRLPASALGAFAHVDEVWVPSTFVHDAVAPFSPVPVVKIPHAIFFTPSADASRSQFGLPGDKLLALVMYDFHSYQYRKNPQAALAAFRQAAAHRTDVALVIKTINGQHHAQAREALKDSVSDLPHIIFIDEFFTRQQTWDLQACCDLLISLHRAEGFGLAPAEMMYLGKPVIATGWSANTDFMTTDNSFPVRYQLQPLQQAVGVYPAGQLWAEADIDHAAWCLTRLLDDPALRRKTGIRAAADIRRQLSPQAVGALVRERLGLLGLWHPSVRP